MKRNDFAQNHKQDSSNPKIDVSQIWNSDGSYDFGIGKAKCSINIVAYMPFTDPEKWDVTFSNFKGDASVAKYFKGNIVGILLTEQEIYKNFSIETKQIKKTTTKKKPWPGTLRYQDQEPDEEADDEQVRLDDEIPF